MRERNFSHFLPLLIVGGDEEKREEKAEEIIGRKLTALEKDPDFSLLSSTASIGIEEVRGVQRFLLLKPFDGKEKIVLIKEAQALTPEAQNALLKTLEEPPAHSLIVLTLPDASLLLATIVSRCSLVQLTATPQVTLSDQQLAEKEKFLTELLTAGVGERFALLEKEGVYKDRESSLNWLNELTVVARKQLLAETKGEKGSQILALIKAINRTKKYLSANCNVRLTMEVFLSEI